MEWQIYKNIIRIDFYNFKKQQSADFPIHKVPNWQKEIILKSINVPNALTSISVLVSFF